VLSHANIVANTSSIVEYLGLSSTDGVLVVLPFHYVYGKSLLNTHVAVGGRVILENRFMFPQEALNTMERREATGFSGVPSSFAILLNKSNIAERELPHLRYVTQAGGAMAPELQRRLMAALPGKRIFIMYGATEASARLSYLPPEELPRKVGSIGKAIPGVQLDVLRDDGSSADDGEVGELVARGRNIMEGYWNDPEETAAVLDEHGYHTGDLGRRDEEGYLYVVGRKREMIKSGAHRISPKEIEEVLLENRSIHEAAVVGAEDEMLGEAIVAFVTLRPGHEAEPDAIIEWCRGRMPQYKVPHAMEIRREFPRNASGKVDKLALKKGLGGG
jgi:acyl-CoA synthetase (AMP-forming)/AMP-acid ligase II